MNMQTLHVDLAQRRYPIHVGSGLLTNKELWLPYLRGKQVLVISDENVAPHYLPPIDEALQSDGRQVGQLVLPPGEQEKNNVALFRGPACTCHAARQSRCLRGCAWWRRCW